ncbi:MAG: TetR/AcrR family transcriptional regulator [Treponema sp.]|nr:TetR/AcrR family transcriptional regulator [Treponema sp.]
MSDKTVSVNTKEKILNVAFSLYEMNFSDASLSRIAKKAGITKTAIYRHFRDKNSLEKEMFRIVYDSFYDVLKRFSDKIKEDKPSEAFALILEFIHKNTSFVSFYMLSAAENSQDNLIIEMKKRKLPIFNEILTSDGSINSLDFYVKTIFSTATIICMVSARKKCPEISLSDEDFYKAAGTLILNGLQNSISQITELRFAQLEQSVRDSIKDLDPPDRIIIALNSAIKKNGYKNVTLEEIARELGMAKSSLYTWFTNKNDLFSKIIYKELDMLLTAVIENQYCGQTMEERVFLIMSTSLEFLLSRPQLINVFQWLLLTENFGEKICTNPNFNMQQIIEDFFKKNPVTKSVPELGFGTKNYEIITNWIFIMPVFTIFHGEKHGFTDDITRAALRETFKMIEQGLVLDKKLNSQGGIK